jgi:hypothetical protein
VNPWSDAEGDEKLERDLFARRARALPDAQVPSLADVLRAADRADRAARAERPLIAQARAVPAERGATRATPFARVVMGLALAAAAFAATLTGLPEGPYSHSPPGTRVATSDGDAGATFASRGVLENDPTLECVEDKEASTCRSDLRYASIDVSACFGPMPTFTAYPREPAGSLICTSEALASFQR